MSGCVTSYSNHNFIIDAKETISQKPASEFPVQVIYPYDSYGIFYILNAPKSVELTLDKSGKAKLQIAEFYNPHIVIGSTIFILDEKIFSNGGTPKKIPYIKDEKDYQRYRKTYNAYNLPFKQYPEVDIGLLK